MVVPIEVAVGGINFVGNAFLQPIFAQILAYMMQALPLVLTFWTKGDTVQDENEFRNPLKSNTYDFIIVGGGSAGGLAAERLSRRHRVLLLEAGGDPNPIQLIPTFAQYLLNFPETDYSYRAVPQKYASQSAINRQTGLSAGKGLGGSGSINLMMHLRGHVKDFDNWGRITGDENWGWTGCLPFFKSYENYELLGDEENHGYDGPLRVEAPDHIGTALEFLRAGEELGYPTVDLNAPYTDGFDVIRYPIRNGVRQATYKAFIEPIRTRVSFTLMKYAQVNKILLRSGNIAYGVEYDRHGETNVAYATKEVVLTAGAIGTAKLLMLSGIGPTPKLQSLGIPTHVDLPVGEKLTDHISTFLGPFFINEPRSLNPDRDLTASEFVRWFTLGRGVLTTTTTSATGVFASPFAQSRGEADWPDTQLILSCITITTNAIPFLANAFNYKLDFLTQYFSHALGRDACFIFVLPTRPLSSGFMELGGSSPYDLPVIDPKYFSDEENIDLEVTIEGVKKALVLMENTTSFGERFGTRFTGVSVPGCEHLPFRSDSYWECYIQRFTLSIYHYSQTARMGSVVDTKLRVKGVSNLRVLDNSVAPEQISTNPQASVLMIAEKGVDMILRKWKGVPSNKNKEEEYLEGLKEQEAENSNNVVVNKKKRRRRIKGKRRIKFSNSTDVISPWPVDTMYRDGYPIYG